MKYIIAINILLIAYSCSNSNNQTRMQLVNDFISLDSLENEAISGLDINEIEIISLETTEESLFGILSKVVYYNNYFFIFDEQTKGVYCFSREGNFISKVRKVGKGPGEYIQIGDFDIDKEGNLLLWDQTLHKINKYNIDGEFIEEYKFDDLVFLNFTIIDDDNFLIHTVFVNGKYKYAACIYNFKKKEIIPILTANKEYEDFSLPRLSFSSIWKSGDTNYFTTLFSSTIYKLNDKLSIESILLKTDKIPNLKQLSKLYVGENRMLIKEDFLNSISNIYETNDKLGFDVYHSNPAMSYVVIKDKSTNKYYCTKRRYNKRYLINNNLLGVAANKFISTISPSDIKDVEWKEMVHNSMLSNDNKQQLLEVNQSSNPLIVLFKFNP